MHKKKKKRRKQQEYTDALYIELLYYYSNGISSVSRSTAREELAVSRSWLIAPTADFIYRSDCGWLPSVAAAIELSLSAVAALRAIRVVVECTDDTFTLWRIAFVLVRSLCMLISFPLPRFEVYSSSSSSEYTYIYNAFERALSLSRTLGLKYERPLLLKPIPSVRFVHFACNGLDGESIYIWINSELSGIENNLVYIYIYLCGFSI